MVNKSWICQMSVVNLTRVLALYHVYVRNTHYIPSYSGDGVTSFLLSILTQILPSKAPLIPATQTFRVLVSLFPPLIHYNSNYTSAMLPETKSFHIYYSFDFQGKEEIGSYYFPLYIQGSYWRSISLRQKQGLTDLSGSRVHVTVLEGEAHFLTPLTLIFSFESSNPLPKSNSLFCVI